VRVSIASESDFATYKGQLKGKIVLAQPARAVRMLEGPFIVRMDGDLAKEAETTPVPAQRGRGAGGRAGGAAAADDTADQPGGRGQAQQFQAKLQQFYKDEAVVARDLDRGSDADTASMGSSLSVNQQHPMAAPCSRDGEPHHDGGPQVTLAVEHAVHGAPAQHDVPVTVEIDLRVHFHENTK
jgi:hypothetical protein